MIDNEKPWKVESPASSKHPIFLLYDPVHILKNLRNNWHSERLQTLAFSFEGQQKIACWNDLQTLYAHEAGNKLKLSNLTKASVYPKKIEKQKVSLALNVFCDKTAAALTTSEISTTSSCDTAEFIQIIVKLWKLFNCKSRYAYKKDKDCMAIDSIDHDGIHLLELWSNYTYLKKGSAKGRQQTLTRDTSQALAWTCSALVDMSKMLLQTDAPFKHEYVLLGFFQQDDLESHFGHFRMSAGGNYYITTQEVFHTHNIDKARIMLGECENLDLTGDGSHKCSLCRDEPTENEQKIINELLDGEPLDKRVNHDTKLSLFYIGGYIAYKHEHLRGDPTQFQGDVGKYLEKLSRGGLSYPTPGLFDLLLIAFSVYRSKL